ncbi:MAG: hypothetical protein ACLUYM_00810 [Oscillospiraceae bacterium]|jgi:hypothetical protein
MICGDFMTFPGPAGASEAERKKVTKETHQGCLSFSILRLFRDAEKASERGKNLTRSKSPQIK